MLFKGLLEVRLCVGPQGGPRVGVVLHQGLHTLPVHQGVAVLWTHPRADGNKFLNYEIQFRLFYDYLMIS